MANYISKILLTVAFVCVFPVLGNYGTQVVAHAATGDVETVTESVKAPDDTGPVTAPQVMAGGKARTPYLSGTAADMEFYRLLSEAKEALKDKDHESARLSLKEMVGRCSDMRITSYEALSAVLIKEGQLLLDQNDIAGAMLFYEYAAIVSPNYPPAYFAKGWGLLAQNKLKLLVASDAFIEGILHSTRDFWWSYNYLGNKATSILFAIAGLFTLFGLFVAIRYTPLLAHDLAEKFDRLEQEPMIKLLLLPSVFTLILLVLGYWWAVTIVLLLLWVYFNKREKTLSIMFFLLLVFMPGIMAKYASFVQGGGNTMLWVMDEVNKGRIKPGTEAFLKKYIEEEPDNGFARMSLAQMYTAQRRYEDAIAVYSELVASEPSSPLYRNNMGNVYFFMGERDKAMTEYKAAIEYGPDKALPHFNLSQLYGEMLMFTERADEDRIASRINPDLVTSLRLKEGGSPLRMAFDFPVPISYFWDTALMTTNDSRELASSLWSTTIKVMPLEGATYAGIGFIVLVLALNALLKKGIYAHFCDKCGKVSCKRCQRPVYSKDLCSQCHQIFVKLEGVEARDRLKKTLEIREKEKREGMLFRISSLFFPGSGHYLIGRPIRGFIFSGVFILLVKDIFFGRFLETTYSFGLNVIGPDTLVLAFLLVLCYVVAQLDIYRLTNK